MSEKKYEFIKTETRGRVFIVTMARPQVMNALHPPASYEMAEAWDRFEADPELWVGIITGEGERAFCAGNDLKYTAAGGEFTAAPSGFGGLTNRLDCNKPVIGAINGPAVGIGATMTLAMDFRLASEKARIGFVFNKLGIVPEACSSWFLPRIVGISQALEWTYMADILSPEEALRGGLLKAVYKPEELLAEARALAHRIIDGRSPVAIALTRQMMYRNAAQPHPLEAHKIDSLAMFYTSIGDGVEGVSAFLEKRSPDFKSRTSTDMPPFVPWQR